MTILDGTAEPEVVQLLNTIQELSDQLARNRSVSITLHASAGTVKVCKPLLANSILSEHPQTQAAHAKTGFVLRRCVWNCAETVYIHVNSCRFNLDKPQGTCAMKHLALP